MRDCLLGAGCDRLLESCSRPKWFVRSTDYYACCFFPEGMNRGVAREGKLTTAGQEGQRILHGMVQHISESCRPRVQCTGIVVHPRQKDPPLPSNVTIDTSHHYPRLTGWLGDVAKNREDVDIRALQPSSKDGCCTVRSAPGPCLQRPRTRYSNC